MHKLILGLFNIINNICQFFSIVCAFFIMAISIFWLETLLNSTWNWLNFIKPTLNIVLDFSNNILPFSIKAFGTSFDAKFLTALIILVIIMTALRFLIEKLEDLKVFYNNAHIDYKLAKEKSFNKKMANIVNKEQLNISKYLVLINTKIKDKFINIQDKIDIQEENKLMNDFINKKTEVQYQNFDNGFLYYFNDFNNIDNILDVLFKVLKSNSRIDYAISVQVSSDYDEDLNKLKNLSNLKQYGKIILCADTVLRYKYNKSHRYGTQTIGIYQKENGTIEVHEFHEIL